MEAAKGGVITRTHAEEVLELSKVLKSLSKFCNTEPAKKKAVSLCLTGNQAAVESELEKVAQIQRSGETAEFYVPFEPNYLKTQVRSGLFLSLEILVRVRRFLRFVSTLKLDSRKSRLQSFYTKLHNYPELLKELDSKIDEAGDIRDDASPDLLRFRTRKKQVQNRIRQTLNAMLSEQPNMYTGASVVERAGHFVLPVKTNFKKQIKGVVHSYSNSGETVFIEPMTITEDTAGLIELDKSERLEIESILQNLTGAIGNYLAAIEEDIEHVVWLDLWFAKARFANDLKANRPVFAERLNIINGFHPILKKINDRVVPLNLSLNSGKRVLLISGPNAGGKTVVLKTVGLIVLMARCGLFIPADEGSTVPFFNELFADIGDEQSIESQLSTFAAHLKQIRIALEGNGNSLVLLDELMSQTSVEEGSALASAILDEFTRREAIVLATTHNENLKLFVSNREDMINGGMEFTDHPTYRLILGVPQPSNALRLASQLGLQSSVLDRAVSYLDQDKMSVNRLFEDLSGQLKAVEEEREKLSSLVDDYEQKLSAFNIKKRKESDELRLKYHSELTKVKKDVEQLIKRLRKEGPKPNMVGEARRFFKDKLDLKAPAQPYHPEVGELVRIRELRRIGQVVAEKQGKYKISLQNIFYWVEPTDIESIREEKKLSK